MSGDVMSEINANLATLIGSRICHDLISPIGAITNGLELLDMTGETGSAEMELISDSTQSAAARIRFFRVAYGSAGEQVLGQAEILSILSSLTKPTRLEVNWIPIEALPRNQVRLAFLAIQCCETALPFGGVVDVELENERWSITASAAKINVDPSLWARLTDEGDMTDGLQASEVQFALLPVSAARMGRNITCDQDDGAVRIRF